MPAFAPDAIRHSLPTPMPTLRRASAEDAEALGEFLQRLGATSRRLRFHGHCNPRSRTVALQLCRVDGVRHQAWLAWTGSGDDAVVVGEARFAVVDGERPGAAELAITVADDWQGRGLADALMRQLLAAAASAGVRELYGDVLEDNTRMQAFMRRHGFESDPFACADVLRMRRAPSAGLEIGDDLSLGGLVAHLALKLLSGRSLAAAMRWR